VKTAVEPSSAKTRANWGEVIEVAAHEVFELMLSSKLAKPQNVSKETTEITSMVGLAGKLCGVMSLRCSAKASKLMASKMLGVPPDQIGPEGCDAFGEVCNMIAGNFKNKIAGLGDGCMLSVPTVITGNDYSLHPPTDSEAIKVTLLFEGMPIGILLQIHS
jgi:chemotaxis protein CheX